MKKLNRILYGVLSGVLLFSLVACSSQPKSGSSSAPSASPSATPAASASAAPSASAEVRTITVAFKRYKTISA